MLNLLSVPFEQGYLEWEDPANPGAGNQFAWFNNNYRRVIIHSLSFVFTADANVANRLLRLETGFVGNIYQQWKTNTTITAGQAHQFFLSPTFPAQEVSIGTLHYGCLFSYFILAQGMIISTVVTNMQAGDAFSSIKMTYSSYPEYRGL